MKTQAQKDFAAALEKKLGSLPSPDEFLNDPTPYAQGVVVVTDAGVFLAFGAYRHVDCHGTDPDFTSWYFFGCPLDHAGLPAENPKDWAEYNIMQHEEDDEHDSPTGFMLINSDLFEQEQEADACSVVSVLFEHEYGRVSQPSA